MTARPAAIALAIGVAACSHGTALPAHTTGEGIAIAIYAPSDREGYAVVDDRRWVDITGDALVLEHVDPRAALPSLLIEPLVAPGPGPPGSVEITACQRDRISARPLEADADAASELAPLLGCAVRGPRGRALVRLLYVIPRPGPQLGYRAAHDVAMTDADRAAVTTRFAIATPAWQRRAEVALFDAVPGEGQPPHELARAQVVLDGSTAIIAAAPRTVTARLRRTYDGAVQKTDDVGPHDPRWRRASHPAVWVWLELDDTALPAGPVHAHIDLAGHPARDVDVPARGRQHAGTALELPLWIDDELCGKRDRWTEARDGAALTDKLAISIANTGDGPREVWIEEGLRPTGRHRVRRAWPGAPSLGKDVVRMKLTIPAGKIERAGIEVEYER